MLVSFVTTQLLLFALYDEGMAGEPPTVWQEKMYNDRYENVPGMNYLTIQCDVRGDPEPKLEFSYDGIIFKQGKHFGGDPNQPIRHQFPGSNYLELTNITVADSGRYRCIATNIYGTAFHERKIKVHVLPTFNKGSTYESPPKVNYPVIGERFSVPCPSFTGKDGTTVRWGMAKLRNLNQNSYIQYYDVQYFDRNTPRIFVTNKGDLVYSVFTLKDLKKPFRCILRNGINDVASNLQELSLKGRATSKPMKPNLEKYMSENMYLAQKIDKENVIHITCGASGFPVPTIHWSFNNVPITAGTSTNFDFIELHGTELRITRRSSNYPVNGFIKCIAKNKLGEDSKTGNLKLVETSLLTKFNDTTRANQGKDTKLLCNIAGYPPAKVEWYKDNVKLTETTKYQFSKENHMLTIKNAQQTDNGVYQCLGENEFVHLFDRTYLEIVAPFPKIQSLVYYQQYRQNGLLELTCDSSGDPEPTITWSFNDMVFQKNKPMKGSNITRHTLEGNRLTLKNVRGKREGDGNLRDTGMYKCIATNKYGTVFTERYIHISEPGVFKTGNRYENGPRRYYPRIGRPFTLKCPPHVKSDGTTVAWGVVRRYSGLPRIWRTGIPNPRIVITSNGDLVYTIVTKDDIRESRDIGGLRCILVTDGVMVASAQQLLYNYYDNREHEIVKPRWIEYLPVTVDASMGKEYQMTCAASGNPLPKISWEHQGKKVDLQNPSMSKHFFFKSPMVLVIKKVSAATQGLYKCYATNNLGTTWTLGNLYAHKTANVTWVKKLNLITTHLLHTDVTLSCSAKGIPVPTIEWYYNGQRLRRSTDNIAIRSNNKDIVIKKASFNRQGMYTCQARNTIGLLSSSTFLKIKK